MATGQQVAIDPGTTLRKSPPAGDDSQGRVNRPAAVRVVGCIVLEPQMAGATNLGRVIREARQQAA
jgi:hypothetical protein